MITTELSTNEASCKKLQTPGIYVQIRDNKTESKNFRNDYEKSIRKIKKVS